MRKWPRRRAISRLHYFDLTEDVETTRHVQRITQGANSAFMPQSGLPPGLISIAAHGLTRRFESLETVRMRVGALPQFPTNALNYNLTWSTEGLINKYCNPRGAIHEGAKIDVLPLQGIEQFSLDGITYEAFNTSGGLGTLCNTPDGRVDQLNYKTVCHPGHCAQMKLLVNDLKLGKRRELFKDVLETAIPMTLQDVVLVFVTVPPLDACWSSGFPSRFSPRSPDDRHSPRRALASTLHRPGRLFRRATRRRRPASAERLRRSSR